jgi:hypothetical protein
MSPYRALYMKKYGWKDMGTETNGAMAINHGYQIYYYIWVSGLVGQNQFKVAR